MSQGPAAEPRARSEPPAPDSVALPAPLAWAREYLPHYFTDDPCAFHRELLADLADPPRRLIARVAPRGHAKSTCAALAFPLWCICERRAANIVIVTHAAPLAVSFVRDIRLELEANDALRAAYGDLLTGDGVAPTGGSAAEPAASAPRRRGKWAASQFVTASGVCVHAKGVGASFRGVRVGPHRPDLIICDDIEKDEAVASPEGRRKLEHWLRRVVLPALAPTGRLVVLGSLLHYDSLLANLRDPVRFPRWDYRVYRALEARHISGLDYALEPLWPARWPVERLREERERVGTLAFEQEYMANPIDDTLRVFQPEWLRRGPAPPLVEGRDVVLMAVDPATGTAGGDFFALWVGSVNPETGVVQTRELTLERIGIVQQVRRITAAVARWRPTLVGIETTAYQVALRHILEDLARTDGLLIPVTAIRTTANKRARIEGSAPFYENGLFRLPECLDPDVEAQFLHFPKARHDDAPDVCAMGLELVQSLRGSLHRRGAAARRGPGAKRGSW